MSGPRELPRSLGLVSLESWDDTWRRNQHLCRELLEQRLVDRMVFVEPPLLGRAPRRHRPLPGVDVVRPPLVIPKRARGFVLTAAWLQASALRGIDLLWVNAPELGALLVRPSRPTVYDVTDDWRTFDQPERIRRRLVAAEDKLARTARTVVCSAPLADRWQGRYGVRADIVNNGVDLAAMDAATPRPLEGAPPHVGYVGTLHPERVDLALLAEIATAEGIGTVHLVGPNHLGSDSDRLRELGVQLHGAVPAHDVPGWLKGLDVLLSPHIITDFTLSLDAIKSYEYLAAGRPVVATPTSGFQLLQADALTCVGPDGFVAAVQAAARSSKQFEPRRSDAWAQRARQFSAILRDHYAAVR